MGFLQHLAQVAGAKVRGNRLFFVIVEVVHLGFVAARMRRGLKFLAFDDLFLNKAGAGSIGRSVVAGVLVQRRARLSFFFAKAEEPETCGG